MNNNDISIVDELNDHLPEHIDYLIVCASFEDRSNTMSSYLERSRVSQCAIFYFEQFYEYTSKSVSDFENRFEARRFKIDHYKPIQFADGIIDFFSDLSPNEGELKKNVVVDISTFNKEGLLIIFRYLIENQLKFSDVIFFYRFAEVSEKCSENIENIRTVLGFMGDIDDRPSHLIILAGYEIDRAKEIIDWLEPNYLSIGNGSVDASITDEFYKKNVMLKDKLLASYTDNDTREFNFSLRNPQDTAKSLINQAKLFPNANQIIVPLNNKISTLGVGLAAIRNSEFQILYSQMSEYNYTGYSRAHDRCIVLSLSDIIK